MSQKVGDEEGGQSRSGAAAMGDTQRPRVCLLTLSVLSLAILSVCKGVKEALLDAFTGLCFIAPLRGFCSPGKGPSDQGHGFLPCPKSRRFCLSF